jgi:hypothetical protein
VSLAVSKHKYVDVLKVPELGKALQLGCGANIARLDVAMLLLTCGWCR